MAATAHAHSAPLHEDKTQVRRNRMGLWLFMLSEVFLFGGILIARILLWGDTRPHLEQGPALLFTAVLLLSSFFMNRAEIAIAYGDRKTFLNGILLTAILGSVFLIGVLFVEWPLSHLSASEHVYGAVFYLMTGMHAFHVLTGIIFLAIIYRNGKKGVYTPQKHWAVEAAAIYWHFVDVVWIFFYPAIYLIGIAAH
ncbi:MAG: cytochrome c oxidase subunit 3 [Anaerolineales bacterium]